ncbi:MULTISPECIES: hypothetical protein [unclassified Mesorhizobium]|uniref:hypothetical protein n=1 Tax=unclassified Mesorhizobium TaxID=325217 RepID=UPI000FDBA623|nr:MULTISPECIES: hypothetical protein [unclassified Mesorhizobium]TGR39572.1 hypothetical protein EN842_40785 [bacterium M00.F.Ca.ET.199.01.1.1]TGU29009.1 hypothetical protein EN799_35960 [bacterium M00.F.Ca.ET.156.01.1.1]TGV84288.1 hypothetical protein EN792_021530 [Mesorhizobium sp. M00.F.Ca.ET.149.01.1.1]TGR22399.1 hypothetical protein EN845_22100 [Mesorhizobium sp. M8A.F.Ca.ET.202.01.1.1]TGR23880.1 hypothetical protein EN840_20745 [Mesorhizobium sp. M8A.F.Ca.ET.197.01.1.1]
MRKKAVRQFHKVSPDVWRSRRFLALQSDEREVWFYLATGPHQTSAGCCKLPPAYAVADLGNDWTKERFLACIKVLVDGDLIAHDPDTDEIYVCRWYKTSPPMNGSHAAGIYNHIVRLESAEVQERVEREFAETEYGDMYITNPSITKDRPF